MGGPRFSQFWTKVGTVTEPSRPLLRSTASWVPTEQPSPPHPCAVDPQGSGPYCSLSNRSYAWDRVDGNLEAALHDVALGEGSLHLARANLNQANLRGKDLRGADLRWAELCGA